ncbi:hypothetical protein AMECASPLE_004677 [Ameca splendens]|uniref:Uncharacterized protein n=1 Tax=Ameca splendens TaxID=208324 RepID=A0ABV0YXM6_9TELE
MEEKNVKNRSASRSRPPGLQLHGERVLHSADTSLAPFLNRACPPHCWVVPAGEGGGSDAWLMGGGAVDNSPPGTKVVRRRAGLSEL